MKINEGTLSKLISEAINEELKNFDNLSELFHSDADFKTHEEKDSDEKKDDMADDKKKTIEGEVSDFFDDNGVNTAQYAYKLYGVKPKKGKDSKDEKNARVLFMKKLHHEKDKKTGYTYSFDSKELNKLESMISDRLNEAKLSKIISESIQKVISDDEIEKQYDDMNIVNFEMEPLRHSSEGWKGTFELVFPNADGVDYDENMVNDFMAYDAAGNRIAWSNWMPEGPTKRLESIIRHEIAKRSH
jgi:hypothetical protein